MIQPKADTSSFEEYVLEVLFTQLSVIRRSQVHLFHTSPCYTQFTRLVQGNWAIASENAKNQRQYLHSFPYETCSILVGHTEPLLELHQ